MLERDFVPFCDMLDDVWGLWPAVKIPTGGQKAMFFRALAEHSIAEVRAGFDTHVKDPMRGRFAPLPADIVAQIEGSLAKDRRPGPEEAWAIALNAADENKTLVWTEEIAQAWGVARTVLQEGDEVGARMAFREVYARLVNEARAAGVLPLWWATVGHDPEQRDAALERAHVAGLLPKPERLRELPAPDHAMSLSNRNMTASVREKLIWQRDELAARKLAPDAPGMPMGKHNPIPPDAWPWVKGDQA
jgi:hypothetical protein